MGKPTRYCHPTQVNVPRLNLSKPNLCSIYLPWRNGRLSWPRWLATYRDGLPAHWWSPIQVLTVDQDQRVIAKPRHHQGPQRLLGRPVSNYQSIPRWHGQWQLIWLCKTISRHSIVELSKVWCPTQDSTRSFRTWYMYRYDEPAVQQCQRWLGQLGTKCQHWV